MRRPARRTVILTVSAVAVIAVAAWLGIRALPGAGPVPAAAAPAGQGPAFRSPDQATSIDVPDGAMAPGTAVDFVPAPAETPGLDATLRGATAAGTPVDLRVTNGSLAPGRSTVTLTYDPALVPAGLTADQVGLAVFDRELDSWIPILDAKADPARHTVSGVAPHFSLFSTIVLNPLKAVVNVAGKAIRTVIDRGVTYAKWAVRLLAELTRTLVKDLFGVAPDLACKPAATGVTVTAKSLLDRLTGCAQAGQDRDTTVRLRNGYAFPLRLDKVPAGMALRLSDVWNNGEDLVNLIRNAYWALQGRAVLGGAALGTVTATPELKKTATVAMDIDADAVGFDMALAFLMVVAPEQAALKPAVKSAAEAAVKGAVTRGEAGKPSAWVGKAFSLIDCVVKQGHTAPPAELFTSAGVRATANVVHACLGDLLKQLDLQGALAELLGTVKVLPETVETVLYPLAGTIAEQIGGVEQQKPQVTVQRAGGTVRFDGIGDLSLATTAAALRARGYTDHGNTYETTSPACVSYEKAGQPLTYSVDPGGRALAIRTGESGTKLSTEIGGIHAGSTLTQLRAAYRGHGIHEYLDLDFGQGTNGVVVDGPGGAIAFGLDEATPAQYASGQARITSIDGVGIPGHAPTAMEIGC